MKILMKSCHMWELWGDFLFSDSGYQEIIRTVCILKICLREQKNWRTKFLRQITKREECMGTLEDQLKNGSVATGFTNYFWPEINNYTEIPMINLLFWNNLWYLYLFLKCIQRQETMFSSKMRRSERFSKYSWISKSLKSKHKVNHKIINICILLKV